MNRGEWIRAYVRITAGCFLFAMAVSFCLEPWKLAAGGVSGLAIVVSRWVPLETGTIILLLNLPLLWLGWRRFGRKFLSETVYATVVSAGMTNLLDHLQMWFAMPPLVTRIWSAALLGGILQAAGIGIIFREGGTTGGTDIVVHLLRDRHRRIGAGWIFLAVDASVIALAALSGFGGWEVVFAVLSLCVFSAGFQWITE
ncbi:MAG: YitT family protein [Clostridia bacterium]|nr:YitT family protein [Clostridia bacterium]